MDSLRTSARLVMISSRNLPRNKSCVEKEANLEYSVSFVRIKLLLLAFGLLLSLAEIFL